MMHTIRFFIWTALLMALFSSCIHIKATSVQGDAKVSSRSNNFQKLIINEYDTKHEEYIYYVVSYNFREGHFISKDTLFKEPGLSVPLIHQDRYLISSSGPIFDMVTKKVIWEPQRYHYFAEARGDTIFYVTYLSTKTHPNNETYYSLNLKNLDYVETPEGSYKINYNTHNRNNRTLYFSPNNQKVVYASKMRSDPDDKYIPHAPIFDIISQDKHTGDTTIVHKINSASSTNVEFSRVAIFWLNHSSFLYDNYHFYQSGDYKGHHNIEIRKYDFDTGSDQLLFRIDSTDRTNIPRGVFRRDAIGQLHYRANNGIDHLLDTTGNQTSIDPYFYLNQNFSYNRPLKKGMTIQYQDSIIAENILGYYPPVASNHSIAVIYRDESPWVGHHKGIKIWTSQQNEWLTIDVPWAHDIIGWIEGKIASQ